MEDLELSFFVKQYMDNPKLSGRVESLGAGEQTQVDLYALFTNELLTISEGSKVSARSAWMRSQYEPRRPR